MTINLSELGGFLASRHSAAKLRQRILQEIRNGLVELDFSGVQGLSDSFADELFGVLAENYGVGDLFTRLRTINANDAVIQSITRNIRYRLEHNGKWATPSDARRDINQAVVARRAAFA